MILAALALAAPVIDAAECRAARADVGLAQVAKDRACYQFAQRRKFTGMWYDDFEGQVFVDDAKPTVSEHPETTWIDVDLTKEDRARLHMAGPMCGHVYRIQFISSVTLPAIKPRTYFGGFGQMGMFGRLVVVDRLLTVTDLGERVHACGP